MAVNDTRQYRGPSPLETSGDDALSVRIVSDIADGINNYYYHVGNFPIVLESWIANNSIPTYTSLVTLGADANENVILYLGKHYWPARYTDVRCWLRGHVFARSAPGDAVTWRLVVSRNLYVGPEAYDSTKLWDSANVTFTMTNYGGWQVQTNTLEIPLNLRGRYVYFLLTGQGANAATRGSLINLSLQPIIV